MYELHEQNFKRLKAFLENRLCFPFVNQWLGPDALALEIENGFKCRYRVKDGKAFLEKGDVPDCKVSIHLSFEAIDRICRNDNSRAHQMVTAVVKEIALGSLKVRLHTSPLLVQRVSKIFRGFNIGKKS